ncbi:hypothetical protein [Sorangium sp. So ce385]|uniref:hypothetical protein n=1 Tax=Sorangium sp. So ce385 TaxID=3133308 RepID=UPI003F5CA8EC
MERAPVMLPVGVTEGSAYELIEIPSDRVDREMLVAGPSSGIPEALQGLFWMDGNPLPDEVVSLGGSVWDAETSTTRIHVYGERVWSWHADLRGRGLYALVRAARLVYELRLDAERTFGEIVPFVSLAGRRVRVPEQLARLTMRRVSDGHWLRESWFFGVFHHVYDLRRIVCGDGSRTDAFAAYASSAPARSALAARRPAAAARDAPG